jgi:hypothetical protein
LTCWKNEICILSCKTTKKVIKSVWRMPWLSEAKKDVISCDKPRGGANILLIRGFPNGATLHVEDMKS